MRVPSALPIEPANDADRDCDREEDEFDDGFEVRGVNGGREGFGVGGSKSGADRGPGETEASPIVFMSFGWNRPRREPVFIYKRSQKQRKFCVLKRSYLEIGNLVFQPVVVLFSSKVRVIFNDRTNIARWWGRGR